VLKMDNIQRVVGAVRQQLRDWQEMCCISDEESQAFQPLHEGRCLFATSETEGADLKHVLIFSVVSVCVH